MSDVFTCQYVHSSRGVFRWNLETRTHLEGWFCSYRLVKHLVLPAFVGFQYVFRVVKHGWINKFDQEKDGFTICNEGFEARKYHMEVSTVFQQSHPKHLGKTWFQSIEYWWILLLFRILGPCVLRCGETFYWWPKMRPTDLGITVIGYVRKIKTKTHNLSN